MRGNKPHNREKKFITTLVLLFALALMASACGRTSVSPKHPHTTDTTAQSTPSSDASSTQDTNANAAASGNVHIAFDFTHMPTQASNQVALWVEDVSGKVVKTLYVSDFTGARRGYTRRKDALPHWVAAARPDTLSDATLDTISSATPNDGTQQVDWDLTDATGKNVPNGKYTVYLEGTLYWGSNVVYAATIDTKHAKAGALTVSQKRSDPDNQQNRDMLQNVQMTFTKK